MGYLGFYTGVSRRTAHPATARLHTRVLPDLTQTPHKTPSQTPSAAAPNAPPPQTPLPTASAASTEATANVRGDGAHLPFDPPPLPCWGFFVVGLLGFFFCSPLGGTETLPCEPRTLGDLGGPLLPAPPGGRRGWGSRRRGRGNSGEWGWGTADTPPPHLRAPPAAPEPLLTANHAVTGGGSARALRRGVGRGEKGGAGGRRRRGGGGGVGGGWWRGKLSVNFSWR